MHDTQEFHRPSSVIILTSLVRLSANHLVSKMTCQRSVSSANWLSAKRPVTFSCRTSGRQHDHTELLANDVSVKCYVYVNSKCCNMFTFWFHRIQQLCDVSITRLAPQLAASAESTAGVVIATVSEAAASADCNASDNITEHLFTPVPLR